MSIGFKGESVMVVMYFTDGLTIGVFLFEIREKKIPQR